MPYPVTTEAAKAHAEIRQRLLRAGLLLHLVVGVGSIGYYLLGNGQWSFVECLYMTIITLTTVGYGEVLPVEAVEGARLYTILLIVVGMGLVLYFASTLTALLVDGNLRAVYRLKKMLNRLASMREHTAVCGLSKTGSHVVEELVLTGHPCAVLDQDPDRVSRILEHYDGKVPALVGDATRDEDLLQLGVDRARALVISLGEDVDNLYCTLSARQLNPNLRIIVTSDDHRLEQKYHHGGADSVVYPNLIGGQRIASQLVRPEVVTFLDLMLRDRKNILRIEQVRLPESGHVVGRSLAASGIRRAGDVLVVAILRAPDGEFTFNPGPETTLQPNDTLIVLGEVGQIRAVREYVSGHRPSSEPSPRRSDSGRP